MNTGTPFALWMIPLILIAFVVFFVVLWSFVCLVLSVIGGWSRLTKHYRATLAPEGKDHRFVFGMVGMASYRGTLNVRTAPQGLYLTVMPIFQIGHPPLFIPWSHIHAKGSTWLGLSRFDIGQPKIATLSLPATILTDKN